MLLIEIESGFLVLSDGSGPPVPSMTKDLLIHMRDQGVPFLVGGAQENVILTIGPLTKARRDQFRNWWYQRIGRGA
jgi:hypothetical protein